MLNDTECFSHLYQIASALNKEFSLHAALRKALERTVDLLELETGWIWLVQGERSVYLAASYNLPPALRDHPERLGGWCYCLEKYLSDNMDKAGNISEIACSRLKNIKAGTFDLKFHATVPITVGDKKVGLINLLSRQSQELNEKQLSALNTISELIGIAVQRTMAGNTSSLPRSEAAVHEVLSRVFAPKLQNLILSLESAQSLMNQNEAASAGNTIEAAIEEVKLIQQQLVHISRESEISQGSEPKHSKFQFPAIPLTKRELELVALVKKGLTNRQIADALFISERT